MKNKLSSPIKSTDLPYCAFGISIEKQIIVKRMMEWDKTLDWIINEEQ